MNTLHRSDELKLKTVRFVNISSEAEYFSEQMAKSTK
jgi:hypothetical protein